MVSPCLRSLSSASEMDHRHIHGVGERCRQYTGDTGQARDTDRERKTADARRAVASAKGGRFDLASLAGELLERGGASACNPHLYSSRSLLHARMHADKWLHTTCCRPPDRQTPVVVRASLCLCRRRQLVVGH